MKTIKVLVVSVIVFLTINSCKKETKVDDNMNLRNIAVLSDYKTKYALGSVTTNVEFIINGESITAYLSEYWYENPNVYSDVLIMTPELTSIDFSFTIKEQISPPYFYKAYNGSVYSNAIVPDIINVFKISKASSKKTNSDWNLSLNNVNIELTEVGGGETYCFVGGIWKKSDCDGAIYNLSFNENKTGYMSYTGCAPWEIKSSRYEFNWSESNGSITYTYTHCEKPIGTTIANLIGGSQSYTCTSDSFTTGGDTWTK